METGGVLERKREVEAFCEQGGSESQDTERKKTFGRKLSRQRGAERQQARNSKAWSQK